MNSLFNGLKALSPFLLTSAITIIVAFYGFPQDVTPDDDVLHLNPYTTHLAHNDLYQLIHDYGYWYILTLCLLFSWILWRTAGNNLLSSFKKLPAHKWGICTIILGSAFLHLHEPHQLKILYDESNLIATSKMMHEERVVSRAARAHKIFDDVTVIQKTIDKRPLLYPFLLSVLHDLTGYRSDNTYFLNGILTVLLLGLIYGICHRFWGQTSGILAVILMCSLPLLAHTVTSGCMDILNLCMILILVLAGYNYLRQEGYQGLWLLIMTAVLLACTRYESILYVLCIPVLCLVKWYKAGKINFHWSHTLAPMLLVGPLLFFVLHNSHPDYYPLDQKEKDTVFAVEYAATNLQAAADYLFSWGPYHTNSLLLSLLGLPALGYAIYKFIQTLKDKTLRTDTLALITIPAITLLSTAMLIFYFWGEMSDPIVSRLYLPFLMAMAIAAAYTASKFKPAHISVLCTSSLIYTLAFTAPTNIQAKTTHRLPLSNPITWLHQQLKHYDPQETLVIMGTPATAIIEGFPATSIDAANARLFQLRHTLKTKYYKHILVFEEWEVGNGKSAPLSIALDHNFATKLVNSAQHHDVLRVLLLEVTDYLPADIPPLPPPLPSNATPYMEVEYLLP